MTRTQWMLVGVAAAVIALIAGVVFSSGDGDERGLETTTPPEESTTTAVPTTAVPTTATPTTAAPTTAAPTTVPTEVPLGTFDANATPLPQQFTSIESGSYLADSSFAAPFSFTTDLSLFLQENGARKIALSSPSSRDPGDLDINVMSLRTALGQLQLDAQLDEQGDGSFEDFRGWLGTLSNESVVSSAEDMTVGGVDAVRFDVEVAADGVDFSKSRIWVVDQEEQSPLAIVAAINDEKDGVWFDVVERVVSTIAFSDGVAE